MRREYPLSLLVQDVLVENWVLLVMSLLAWWLLLQGIILNFLPRKEEVMLNKMLNYTKLLIYKQNLSCDQHCVTIFYAKKTKLLIFVIIIINQ